MNLRVLALFALLAPLPGLCQANKGCPWLNVATATGVLRSDGDPTMATLVQGSPALCSFEYRDAKATRELRITVEQGDPEQVMKAHEGQCSSRTTPLQAIGNEAVACALREQGNSEMIVGRVRDQIFTVSLISHAGKDPDMDALQEKTRNIAEQVAGALF